MNNEATASCAEREDSIAYKALQDSEERYRRLFESAQDGILILDAESGMIVDINPYLLQLTGVTREICLGRRVWEMGFLKHLAANQAMFLELQQKDYVRYEDLPLEAADGRVLDVEFVSNVYLVGKDRVIQCNIRDISARKALGIKLADAQRHLLQSDKLAAIGQLAAGVAHEINNPVGFVTSNLGTLEKYVADLFEVLDAYVTAATSDAGREPALARAIAVWQAKDVDYMRGDSPQLIGESLEGMERVRRIVQDLKGLAHIDDDEWKWSDLNRGIESTLNIVWNQLKYHCTVHKELGEIPEVWCLPSQVNQVVMNLLVNAGQAIKPKGDITIRSAVKGDEVSIAITDTGSGMSSEILERLFEPFFTTKPPGQGTGLGLSVSFSIVTKHRGRIEVSSAPGQGSTFTVWLPINSGVTKAETADASTPPTT